VKNIRQTDSPPSSPFEQMIENHFEWVKKRYQQKKEDLRLARKLLVEIRYLEKFRWIHKYMDFLEVFHLNELHRLINLMKDDLGDYKEKTPHASTLSDYLQRLHLQRNQFGENLLGFKALPSNLPNMYHIYWIPGTTKTKIQDKIKTIIANYREPKSKKDKRQEQFDNTVQSRITSFRANVLANKLIANEKETQQKERELERQKQKEQERKQKELENEEKNKNREKALRKHAEKTQQKKTKNGLKGIDPEESQKKVKELNKERKIRQEEQEYQLLKKKLAQEKIVSEGSEG
jgi:hypothetical protein